MRLYSGLLALFVWLCFACHSSESSTESTFKEGRVILRGKIKAAKNPLLYFPVTEHLYDIKEDRLLTEGRVDQEGNFLIQFDLDAPKVLKILGREAYVTPGETVDLAITIQKPYAGFERVLWEVQADFPGNYLYFSDTTLAPVPPPPSLSESKGVKSLLAQKQSLMNQRVRADSAVDHYAGQALSPNFQQWLKMNNKYQYLSALMSHLPMEDDGTFKSYPAEYLQDLKDFPWNTDTLYSGLPDYYYSLSAYTFQVLAPRNLDEVIQLIDHQYTGRNREYLYYGVILEHRRTLWGIKNPEEFKRTRKNLSYLYNQVHDERFTSLLHQIDNGIPAEVPFTDSVKNLLLTDINGKEFQLGEVLKQVKTPFVYVNFWESECKPCMDDFKFYEDFAHSELTSQITYLMLSSDPDEKHHKWVNTHSRSKLPQQFSYRFKGDGYQVTKRAFNIRMQPRYTIVNENNLLFLNVPALNRYQRLSTYLKIASI